MIKTLKFIEWLLGYINRIFGAIASFAMIAFIFVTFSIAILRETFLLTNNKLDDSATLLFAMIFTFATGYTLLHRGHVRIDIFYAKKSPRTRAIINIIGNLFLGFPSLVYLLIKAWPKAQKAYELKLTSQYLNGLSFYWVLKYTILLAAILFILQLIALTLRSILVLLGEPEIGARFAKPIVEPVRED